MLAARQGALLPCARQSPRACAKILAQSAVVAPPRGAPWQRASKSNGSLSETRGLLLRRG